MIMSRTHPLHPFISIRYDKRQSPAIQTMTSDTILLPDVAPPRHLLPSLRPLLSPRKSAFQSLTRETIVSVADGWFCNRACPFQFDVSAWSFSREVEHGPEPDDWLHNATESSALGSGSIFTWRGLMNIGFLCVIATALLFLFAGQCLCERTSHLLLTDHYRPYSGYPILANFAKIEQSAHGAFKCGQ